MLKQNAWMWRVLCGLVVLVACVKPNPESCADGSCTDPKFPFCDVNGEVGGTPNKCIAVDCNPLEFEACRGDDAIMCNSSGNNLDVVQCQFGCADAIGCRECADESNCAATAGVCDQETYSCRACHLDSECSSNVCDLDTGKCLAEAGILYVSPNGDPTEACTKTAPCSLARAFSLANAALPTIRMLPGDYVSGFTLTNKKLTIIGVGATITMASPSVIGDGADVIIRGLKIVLSGGEMQCKGTVGNQRARMELRDVVIREPATYPLRVLDCVAKITNSEIRGINAPGIAIFQRNSIVDVDRTLFKGATGASSNVSISHLGLGSFNCGNGECAPVDVRITNSVFDDTNIFPLLSGQPNNVRIAFNTHVIQDPNNNGPAIACDQVGTSVLRVENSAIVRNGQDSIVGNGCQLKNNVIFLQITPLSGTGNKFEDPKFVDFAMRDYRLRSDSPARDVASPSADLTTDHDFLGVPRPQGSAHDVGAFELKP